MKQTSIYSYKELKSSGTLSKRQQFVLDYVKRNGANGCKASDIPMAGWKRLAELKRMGVVIENGNDYDEHTKRTVTLWKATGNKPNNVKAPKKREFALSRVFDEAFESGYRLCLNHYGLRPDLIQTAINRMKIDQGIDTDD